MKLSFCSFIVTLLFAFQAMGQSQIRCVDLFFQPIINEAELNRLPPLFRDDEIAHLSALYLETAINSDMNWNYTLGDLRVTRIENLTGARGVFLQVEFTLEGEALKSRVTTYLKIKPTLEASVNSITGLMELAGLEGSASVFMSPAPTPQFLESQPLEVQRQINKDLVYIASKLLLEIPADKITETGMTLDRLRLNLDLQARGLHVVDSPLSARGESPALWVLRLYLQTFQVHLQ